MLVVSFNWRKERVSTTLEVSLINDDKTHLPHLWWALISRYRTHPLPFSFLFSYWKKVHYPFGLFKLKGFYPTTSRKKNLIMKYLCLQKYSCFEMQTQNYRCTSNKQMYQNSFDIMLRRMSYLIKWWNSS